MTVLSDSGVMAHCCIIGKKESMLIDNRKFVLERKYIQDRTERIWLCNCETANSCDKISQSALQLSKRIKK